MNKFLFATTALVLMTVPGLAADMVDVDTTYDWSGAYVGLNGGYGFGGDDRVGIEISNGAFYEDIASLDISGPFGGIQAGWNFQTGSWVFGVEGDVQFADIDDDFGSVSDGAGGTAEGSSEVDFFGTARLRGGWALDRLLIYGTGGLAWVNVDYDVRARDANGNTVRMSSDDIEFGYAVGGGAEYAIDDSWSIKAEYLFIGLGSEDITGNVRDSGGNLNGVTATTIMTPSFHTVRLGVNWQF